MKEYCVDLELAKELKENGFPQTSYQHYKNGELLFGQIGCVRPRDIVYSAPTSDEILKELPLVFRYNKTEICLEIYSTNEPRFFVTYWDCPKPGESEQFLKEVEDKKLSNALAKCWIWLKQGGYLDIKNEL